MKKARDQFLKAGKKDPEVFTGNDQAYRELLRLEELDGVLICTPWRWHFSMAVDAMRAKKYVGLEVCGAQTVQQCWDLVNAHEQTGTHLYFMENVCYRRDVMAVLNMVRQGLFGEFPPQPFALKLGLPSARQKTGRFFQLVEGGHWRHLFF